MESILSLIAIIVSVVTLLIQHYTGNKHNKINLEGEMFRKIYLESITITIPKFRNEMQYAKKSKKIHKIPQMQNQMNSIRFESLFYKYSDNKFYEKIELKTNDIEDFLSTYLRPNITEEEHKEFEKLLNVYLILNNSY
ncbi:hypothetical protein JZO79_01150, partial [Vagococcus fluvialis]|uniref:hypothetical protein n=1 Tax=Vagococcus fluvialis TaxID=2738 RepID=UPI001A8F0DEE